MPRRSAAERLDGDAQAADGLHRLVKSEFAGGRAGRPDRDEVFVTIRYPEGLVLEFGCFYRPVAARAAWS